MSNPIAEFLDSRKQEKLKKPTRPVEEIEQEFQVRNWVANAASRASQLSLVSHPGKFSHPDARITPVLFVGAYAPDGYLRSGNARAGQDVVGNAAALDVYGFLSLDLEGRDVLTHFEDSSEVLQGLLGVDDATFQQWRREFLLIKSDSGALKTHTHVKQVYFPVDSEYHLLSILYPSGLMTEHRHRIRQMKFSDETRAARDARKKNEFHPAGFADMPGLLTQHFGGTKPQNISKLNSNNGGEAWLMPCLPPGLRQDYLHLPKTDFFQWLRWDDELRDILSRLHQLLRTDYNTVEIRRHRQRRVSQLFDWVLTRAFRLQQQAPGWSGGEGFDLPLEQRWWLDDPGPEADQAPDDWRQVIARQISEWILTTYRQFQKQQGKEKEAVQLGETEARAFQQELLEHVQQNKELIL